MKKVWRILLTMIVTSGTLYCLYQISDSGPLKFDPARVAGALLMGAVMTFLLVKEVLRPRELK